MYICIYVYMYICIYVYMYMCIYVYMHIYIYIHLHTCMYMYSKFIWRCSVELNSARGAQAEGLVARALPLRQALRPQPGLSQLSLSLSGRDS